MKLKLLLRKYLGIDNDIIDSRNEMLQAFKQLERDINDIDIYGLDSKIDEVAYKLEYYDNYDFEEMYSNIAYLLSNYTNLESTVTAHSNTHSAEISELKQSVLNICASIENVSNSIDLDTSSNSDVSNLINQELAKYTVAVAASLRKVE